MNREPIRSWGRIADEVIFSKLKLRHRQAGEKPQRPRSGRETEREGTRRAVIEEYRRLQAGIMEEFPYLFEAFLRELIKRASHRERRGVYLGILDAQSQIRREERQAGGAQSGKDGQIEPVK